MRKLTIAAGVAVCCWVAAITTAAAQQRQIDFDLQSFHRAAMAGGLFYTEGADIATHMVPRARLAFDYHYKPLVYEGFELQTDAIGTRLTGDIAVSIGFFGRIELGLALPFIAYQAGSQSPLSSGMGTAGLGDLRILSKVRLFTRSRTTVSLKAAVAVPTADKTLVSGGSLSVVPGVLASYRGDRVALLASADYRFVPRRELFDLVIDDQIAFAAGASYRLTDKLSAIVELNAAARAASPFSSRRETPAQALAGVRYYVGDFAISGNVGPGLVGGYGTAAVQFGAGLAYDPAGLDSDGDGVRDRDDACNGEREDRDGFQDHDGCPDPDNDGDGILDVVDKCPNEPEDRDGFQDDDGCPDLDNDGDGIPDKKDACPNDPEDKDGFQDDDGCPDLDNDRDGIPDKTDKCPNEAEVINGIDDADGCPEPDRDADGIMDDKDKCPDDPEDKNGIEDDDGCPDDPDGDRIPSSRDKCPDEPETYNGYQDKDGCPDERTPRVVIHRTHIWTSEAIYFEFDTWHIRARSRAILRRLASAIAGDNRVRTIYVEGHADPRGGEKYNQWLSFKRAQNVVRYLSRYGAPRRKLRAVGWGVQRPWETNTTNRGMARNRRVLFHVEYHSGVRDTRQHDERVKPRDETTAPKTTVPKKAAPKTVPKKAAPKTVPKKAAPKKAAPSKKGQQ